MSTIRSKPLNMTEMQVLAHQRTSAFIESANGVSNPAHIAIIHSLSEDFQAGAGITSFMPLKPIETFSEDIVYELWSIGRHAARSQLKRYDGAVDNVQLLATVIVDTNSVLRKMWINSPSVNETIECILVSMDNERTVKSERISGRQFSFPVECGFKLELATINLAEIIKCN